MKKEEKKYYLFKYNVAFMNLFSFLLLIILAVATYFLYNKTDYIFDAKTMDIKDLKFILFIIGLVLWLFVHEVIHALSYVINGAKPSSIETGVYIEKGVFYCSCKQYISRRNIMISSLAPFTIIGIITYIIGFIINNPYLILYSLFNISGSAGDLVLFNFLRNLPKDIEYREYDDVLGFCISSKSDLSKIKSIGVSLEETLDNDERITKCRNKQFYITKTSLVFLIIIIAMLILSAFYAIK